MTVSMNCDNILRDHSRWKRARNSRYKNTRAENETDTSSSKLNTPTIDELQELI
jgi:hypothetical protein